MIVFDLRCSGGHVFEAWFGSSEAYATQRDAGQIACPLCADTRIDKALMAPHLPAKSNQRADTPPASIKAALQELAAVQKRALADSQWVGGDFATRARAMHDGEERYAAIHGQATLAEAKALVDDGVPVAPLPFPVIPPEAAN
ncbi:DUF1178 family protein [Sphingomonas sp. XXL09]|uniref:DUF1178 family protein n=1 Tax=Sphingomonas sp. XXL09 TaxID=3457787 RepID=UPI00406BCBAB